MTITTTTSTTFTTIITVTITTITTTTFNTITTTNIKTVFAGPRVGKHIKNTPLKALRYNMLPLCPVIEPKQPNKVGTNFITPVQLRKSSCREVKFPSQDHTASKLRAKIPITCRQFLCRACTLNHHFPQRLLIDETYPHSSKCSLSLCP